MFISLQDSRIKILLKSSTKERYWSVQDDSSTRFKLRRSEHGFFMKPTWWRLENMCNPCKIIECLNLEWFIDAQDSLHAKDFSTSLDIHVF